MRLTKIYVENFGVLKNYNYEPTASFNQIYGENGTGKSTLAVFIKAMFFGMPQSRTRKLLDEAERKKFKSWQGGNCGGYICFEEKGKEYRVTRTFGDRESEDTFSLTDEVTGLKSTDYSADIGREIFGIDREAFGSTVWITAKNMQVAVNDSIHAKLGTCDNNETTFGCDIDNYDKGIERLEEAYKRYVRTGRRGLIYETEDDMADLKLQIQEKRKRLHAVEGMIESLNKRIESRYMSVKSRDVQKLDDENWRKRLEWLDDYFSKGVQDEKEIGSSIAANDRQIHKLEDDIKKQERRCRNYKSIIAGLSLAVVLLLCIVAVTLSWVGIFLLVLSAATLVIVTLRFNKISTGLRDLVLRIEKIKKDNEYLKEQRSLIAEYSYLSERDAYREKLKKQLDVQKYQLELDNYCNEQEKINSDIENLWHNIKNKQETLNKYEYNAEIIKKTHKYLAEARNSYVIGYKDIIAGKMAEYLTYFDEKLAGALRVNADFIVSVAIGATDRDMDYFSSGIKDVMWFCERLAIADALFGENSFIIMDDTFINMDDNMMDKALELTARLSEKRQIIYMTCRKSGMYRKKDKMHWEKSIAQLVL